MTMITPSYLGETIEYSSLHACRSTLEDPTSLPRPPLGICYHKKTPAARQAASAGPKSADRYFAADLCRTNAVMTSFCAAAMALLAVDM